MTIKTGLPLSEDEWLADKRENSPRWLERFAVYQIRQALLEL